MNTISVFILLFLVFDFLVNVIADRLYIQSLSEPLPDEFSEEYTKEEYVKTQAYTRSRTGFGLLHTTFDLAVLLVFWWAGGFGWLDKWIHSMELNTIYSGITYISMLMIAKSILSLPFSIYSTFVIEARFGFNKTTPKTFVLDLLKGALLAIALGIPVLAAVLAFFEYTGEFAWLWAWITLTLFSFVIQYAAPKWLMPLFNTFTPLEDGELKQAIDQYTQKISFPVSGIFVIDGSRRSSKSNAFFTGFGKNKRIALFDTLVNQHTADELLAVLAHEVGHFKKKHILKGIITGIAQTGIMFFILSLVLSWEPLYTAFWVESPSTYVGLVLFGMLYAPVSMVLSVISQWISRKHEFEADAFAAETTSKPEAMIGALKKLSKHNLSHLTPHPFYVFLNYSHPPVVERIRALAVYKNNPASLSLP